MRNKKQPKKDSKLVDKFMQYRNEFIEVCEKFGIDHEAEDKSTLIPAIVAYGDDWMHANLCPYFKHKDALETSAKETVKRINDSYRISTGDLNNMVEVNLRVEKGEADEKFIKSQRGKHDSSLFVSNLMKRTFDSAIDDTMTDTNHVVLPKKSDLKFVDKTNKSDVLSDLITDLTDSRREYLNITNPQFEKILHAIVYASGCTLDDREAKAIMMFAHCPDGDWHRKKSPMWRITEKLATAYRLITKNNLYFHEQYDTGLDEVNFWLGLHGLRVVDIDFDNKEKQYLEIMKQAEEEAKGEEGESVADARQIAIEVIQDIVYRDYDKTLNDMTPYHEEIEKAKELFGIRSPYLVEKRRKEFEEVSARAKRIV